jgi:Chaperone of endosialidase
MKRLLITVYVTVFFGCFFGKAQSVNSLTTINQPATITTNPNANLSQFEIRGNKLITQNFQNSPTGTQFTGNFTTNSRWNSMGSLNAGSQVLNGFRTQTNGRGLTMGYSILGVTALNPTGTNTNQPSNNPTIQWIGNAANGAVTPGNLEFKYALNPGAPNVPAGDANIFTMAPAFISPILNIPIPSFNYAERAALIGQKESGAFGSFNANDIWSATGRIFIDFPVPIVNYGTRHQYQGNTINTGFINNVSDVTNIFTDAVLDYGYNLNSVTNRVKSFKFRTFSNPFDINSNRNIWQSNPEYGNMMLGRDDINNVNTKQYYFSLFDGKGAQAGVIAQDFIQRAGIYATSAGFTENGEALQSYAAVVGDVSLANDAGFNHIGVLGIASKDPASDNKWAGYFVGSTFTSGTAIVGSDRKLKTEIKDELNMMAKLMQLKPKNYFFDMKKYPNMGFSNKLQHGLISQELEEVFPELVHNVYGPIGENGKPEQFKGVNYSGLIPMLIQGIQEQQVQIDELKAQLKSTNTLVLNDKLNLPVDIENKAFSLSQNTPNPFSDRTTISYTIPATVQKATLAVFDLTGKMLLQYNLLQGKNTVQIDGNTQLQVCTCIHCLQMGKRY